MATTMSASEYLSKSETKLRSFKREWESFTTEAPQKFLSLVKSGIKPTVSRGPSVPGQISVSLNFESNMDAAKAYVEKMRDKIEDKNDEISNHIKDMDKKLQLYLDEGVDGDTFSKLVKNMNEWIAYIPKMSFKIGNNDINIKVLHCKMDLSQAKLIFELYNRSCDEYNPENNDLGYQGLDNLVDEVIVARAKMRSEMEPGVDYSGPSEDIEERIDFIQEQIKKNPKRYSSIKKYIENCADDYAIIECVFESDSIGEENYYWIDQAPVTEQEYNSETGWGFNHWYEVAELFEAGKLPFDLTDEDTVSIFGTNKFVAFADLSYGC